MTPEQQREQWLKRILPALAVAVFYFVFVSGWAGEKKQKAEKQFVEISRKGINEAALPGMEQERGRVQADIAKLEEENKKLHQALSGRSGFLSTGVSSNVVVDRLASILAEHGLQLLEEVPGEQVQEASVPKSIKDAQLWLQDIMTPAETKSDQTASLPAKKEPSLNIRKIRFVGSYPDTYRALAVLADSDIRALPVSLTMKAYGENAGKQEWMLRLWL